MKRKKRIQFRVTSMEHSRYTRMAKLNRMNLAEFIRKKLDGQHLNPKLTDEDLALMKNLFIESNRWQNISNLFRKKDPRLSSEVEKLIKDFREIITNNFK
ncbi:plasmid mobilization protein [Nonlabens antarcticus]|uniref:plasmid mobilization protein n=1 Tax=Nonlabens antarcticus TaxID=392714 RepID=UPI0018912DDE|nr:hypothetical protein [Nonlabens antarcticus]